MRYMNNTDSYLCQVGIKGGKEKALWVELLMH